MNNVRKSLIEAGYNPRLRGTEFIAQAVERVGQSPGDYVFVTKSLYPALARDNATTWTNVERCMRYAAKKAGASYPVGQLVFEYAFSR